MRISRIVLAIFVIASFGLKDSVSAQPDDHGQELTKDAIKNIIAKQEVGSNDYFVTERQFTCRGLLVQTTVYLEREGKPFDSGTRTTYSYDEQGKLKKSVVDGKPGTGSLETVYTYDGAGERAAEIIMRQGRLAGARLYQHSSLTGTTREDLTIFIVPAEAGWTVEKDKTVSTYDSKGELVGKERFSNGQLAMKESVSVIEKKKRIEWLSFDEAGRYRKNDRYLYDEFGNEVEHRTYDLDERLIEETVTFYKFDDHGSWIERMPQINFQNQGSKSVPQPKESRTITYCGLE